MTPHRREASDALNGVRDARYAVHAADEALRFATLRALAEGASRGEVVKAAGISSSTLEQWAMQNWELL